METDDALLEHVTLLEPKQVDGSERDALVKVDPEGFHLRPPQPPNELVNDITSEADLFQTIHMGSAIVDKDVWRLVVDGLVQRPFSINWSQLLRLPKETVTSFHECYGSPIKPPDTNLWRIGNVTWTGVPLALLLELAKPKPEVKFVWSDGLERGSFFEAKNVDRYQKDLPMNKALTPGCLVAYEMNGEPIGRERGGPVRLIVPGWYGTNSVKWLCRLSLQEARSSSPFTTIYYNEIDPSDPERKRKRPCWEVEPNSFLLIIPAAQGTVRGPEVCIAGRAWGAVPIRDVSISVQERGIWLEKRVTPVTQRKQHGWQYFETELKLDPGKQIIRARATDNNGCTQSAAGRRNHMHQVEINVVSC